MRHGIDCPDCAGKQYITVYEEDGADVRPCEYPYRERENVTLRETIDALAVAERAPIIDALRAAERDRRELRDAAARLLRENRSLRAALQDQVRKANGVAA